MAEWRVYEYDTPQCTSCGMWMPFARYRRGQGTEAGKGTPGSPAGCTDTAEQNHVTPYCISSYQSNAMLSDNPHSGIYKADVARTLDLNGGSPACNQGGVMVVYVDKEDR